MNSKFNRYLVTLLTGTIIGQAIPIAITPILTRLYTPADFGLLAIFVGITLTIGSIANARYELAIMLPKNDKDAFNVAVLCLLIAVLISLVTFLIAWEFNDEIELLLGNKDIGLWLYLIPVVIFSTGLYNTLNYLNTRKALYKPIARSKITQSSSMCVTQLTLSYYASIFNGLIVGQIIGSLISNISLFKSVKKDYSSYSIDFLRIKILAKRYKKFPQFSMWAILANNLSIHLNNMLVSVFYSVSTLGFYALAQRILGLPSTIVGNSIGQVYFQQATEEKKKTGQAWVTYRATLAKLFVMSCVFFIPLYFIIEDVFRVVFGNSWLIAGTYAKVLIPFFAIRFVASALSNTNNVFEKQFTALVWQVTLLLINVAVLFFSYTSDFCFLEMLYILSMANFIHYVILILITMKYAKG
ncbi:oligosaccharide flippase family protein [Shewanella algae]|uniref:oligosaccharide flippase family protein n=1 Tax=Shewanella algae TaxID=38313 RepID=UPI001AAEA518|nr:oligosaccharide flippase family protein [Shewanella algae]MBO2586078.1 oligosaccharide flippase family protein [Shewanella algae]